WVTDNLPGSEKRRQREAYRRGVLRAILVGGVILAAVLALVIVAFKQRNRAIQETLLRRRLSYTMQVNLAYQELDYGQVNRVEDLLAATAPLPGEKDFRGFEWFALWEAIHKDIFQLKGNSPIGGIMFLDDGYT